MRQTSEQIDQGILDVAAGIFATYGFAHTSVQQIADAVGYSKAGLLHRFGSKQALHRAVIETGTAAVQEVIDEATAHAEGADRARHTIEVFATHVFERPGMVQLMLHAFDPTAEDPGTEEIQALGYRLVDLLDRPVSTPAERLRVVLALQLLVNAALAQESALDRDLHVDRATLVPLLVDLASYVLGAPNSAS